MNAYLAHIWKTNRIIFVLVIAFGIRVIYALHSNIPIMSDSMDFDLLGNNLLHGNGFSLNDGETAYRLPAYPYFLFFLRQLNTSILFIQIVQSAIDTISCYLAYRLGKLTDENSGLYAATLWALFPSAIILSSLLLTETLFTAILLFVTLWGLEKESHHIKSIIIGFLSAIAILMKPHFVLLLGGMVVWKLFSTENRKNVLLPFGIIGITIILSVSPWMVRNHELFGTYSLSTNGGVNFWIGNNQLATGGYYFVNGNEIDTIKNEREKNIKGYEQGLQFIANHPVKAVMLIPKKIAHLFSSQNYLYMFTFDNKYKRTYKQILQQHSILELISFNIIFVLIIIGGAAGLMMLQQIHTANTSLYGVQILAWIFFHLLYFGGARFLFPILPFFAIGAGSYLSIHNTFRYSLQQKIFLIIFCIGFLSVLTTEMIIVFGEHF